MLPAVPGWLVLRSVARKLTCKPLTPAVFDTQREGIGQECFENLGRQLGRTHAFQPVPFSGFEIHPEPFYFVHDLAANGRRRPEQ